MAHPGGQLKARVEVERSPRRIDRRLDFAFGVEFAERGGVRRDFKAGGEVAAARLDDGVRAGGEEVAPEAAHLLRRRRDALRVEGLFVEERARNAPRLLAEAHAVGEPDVVDAEVPRKRAVLRAEECADGKPLGDAFGEGGVAAGVGVERGRADEETARIECVAKHHLAVAAELEIGDRELRAVVEGRAHADFAAQLLARGGAGLAEIREHICANYYPLDFTLDEILNPKGWVLLHYLMDPRTGLGRFREFRISNYDLMMQLISCCMDHSVDEILELPDVKERVDLYFQQAEMFKEQLQRIAKVYDKVVVLDLRNEEIIHAGNRFMIYALYPEAQISVHVAWGFRKQNTAVMIGKSIVNKASDVDIGELCLRYGGGGHRNAGTCQLENDVVDQELPAIIAALNG